MSTIPAVQQRLFILETSPFGLTMHCLAAECSWFMFVEEPITLETLTAQAGRHLKEKR